VTGHRFLPPIRQRVGTELVGLPDPLTLRLAPRSCGRWCSLAVAATVPSSAAPARRAGVYESDGQDICKGSMAEQ
jgi:hypothetical protein